MPEPETQSPDSWLKAAILSGVLYGIPMGILFSFQSGRWDIGLPMGILAGLLFGAVFTRLIRTFTQRQTAKFRVDAPDFGTESVLMEGPCNHFKGVEGVGGYLWLTDGRVHFASHSFNVQNYVWTAQLRDIRDAAAVKTLGLIDNGIQISTAEATERFVVNNSKTWTEMIRKQIQCHT